MSEKIIQIKQGENSLYPKTIPDAIIGLEDWTSGKIVYDISVAHPDGQGNPTPYADLTAALGTGGANIPVGLRKGGISVKFIQGTEQSSDNKYVQYRLMSDTFTTNTTQWQSENLDTEPTAGSDNLVKSSGIYSLVIKIVGFGTKSGGDSGVTGINQTYFNTGARALYACTEFRDVDDFDQILVPFYPGAIYTYNNELYIWNGNSLVKKSSQYSLTKIPGTGTYKFLFNDNEIGYLSSGYKLIKLVGFGSKGDGTSGVTGINQTYYNTLDHHIYTCTTFRSSTDFDQIDTPYYPGAIYIYNNELYIYNGSELICKTLSDNEPVFNSENLVKSGGTFKSLATLILYRYSDPILNKGYSRSDLIDEDNPKRFVTQLLIPSEVGKTMSVNVRSKTNIAYQYQLIFFDDSVDISKEVRVSFTPYMAGKYAQNASYKYFGIFGKRVDDGDVDVDDVIIEYYIENTAGDELSNISNHSIFKYYGTDFEDSKWYQGTTIGGTLSSITQVKTASIRIEVEEGDSAIVTCSGGSNGRGWYQLNESYQVVSMAEASIRGSYKISIGSGVKYLIVQTNAAAYKQVDIIKGFKNLIKEFSKNNNLSGKRISILGDSISTFGVPNQSNATGTWTYPGNICAYPSETLFENVEYCYWYRLIQRYNLTLGINESFRGTRVSWNGVTESSNQGANKYIGSMHRINHLDDNGIPDIIMVFAGTNDIGASVTIGTFNTESPINYTDEQIAALPVNTFADAYRTLMIRLQKYYPTSRIIVLLPNFTDTYYTVPSLDNYLEVIKEICDYFGVQYIDLRTAGITMFNRSTYLPDGIHPNAVGHRLLYQLLCRNYFDELNDVGI